MKLALEVFDRLCELCLFEINGVSADYDDFGEKYDRNEEIADDYGCGDMRFTPKLCTQEILDKYKINVYEYNEICKQLEEKLSFGNCGWCI